jgi:hypothetical protein
LNYGGIFDRSKYVRVVAKSGLLPEETLNIKLNVPKDVPDILEENFELSASPEEITIEQGETKEITIRIDSIDGFSSYVSLITRERPSLFDTYFVPSNVKPSPDGYVEAKLYITVKRGSLLNVLNDVVIVGKSGLLPEDMVVIKVTVPKEVPDILEENFKLSASTEEVTINQGETKEITLRVESIDGFNSPVTLTAWTPRPLLIEPTITPSEVTPSPDGYIEAKLSIKVNNGVFPYLVNNVVVTAKSGLLPEETLTVKVTVPEFDFSLSVEPSSRTIYKRDSTTYYISVELVSGSPKAVWLRAAGLPSATITFSKFHDTPPYTSTMTVDTNIATLRGTNRMIIIQAYNLNELLLKQETVYITIK